MANDVGQFAPQFSVWVEGHELPEEVTRFIEAVEFESADGLIDVVTLHVANPKLSEDKSSPFYFTDRRLFYPGNVIDVFMGYKQPLRQMARVRLVTPEFDFPGTNTASFTINGYAPSYQMTNNSPAAERHALGEDGRNKKKQKTPERILSKNIEEIVRTKADAYGFKTHIDPIEMKLRGSDDSTNAMAFQRVGMTDYDLIKGLSNITGYIFWVDHFENFQSNFSEQPVLHFLNPAKLQYDAGRGIQDKKYTFKYGDGNNSTLLNFRPTYTLAGMANKMVASIHLPDGKIIEQEMMFKQFTPDTQIDFKFTGKIKEKILVGALGELKGPEQIKLVFNDFSIDVVPVGQSFSSPEDLERFMKQWYERHRNEFIQANGTLIGLETLLARQVHTIKGLGDQFDGDYYFPRVRHKMSSDGGYVCDVSMRKVVGRPPEGETHVPELDEVRLLGFVG